MKIWTPKKQIALPQRQRGFFTLPGSMGASKPSGGGSSYVVNGALVRLSADQTPATVYSWTTETFDTANWHDNSTNPERMTVPSGVSLVRTISNVQGTSGITDSGVKTKKGGSDFDGQAYAFAAGRNPTVGNAASAVLSVSSGDYFTLNAEVSALMAATETTWFAIEEVPAAAKYCLIRKNATQSLTGTSQVNLTWQTEVVDNGGWFDSATSTINVVVPSGVSYVRVSGNLDGSSATGQSVLGIRDGSNNTLPGCTIKDLIRSGIDNLNVVSAVMAVSAGDIFRLYRDGDSTITAQNTNATWMCVEEVSNMRGCLAYKNASQAITAGVETAVALGAESYDTDNAHDNVTQNSRITVPSGFTKARPSFGLSGPSASGVLFGRVLKNGAAYHGMPSHECDTTGADFVGGIGAWVTVSPGDYFEIYATHGSSVTLPVSNATWLCVEFGN